MKTIRQLYQGLLEAAVYFIKTGFNLPADEIKNYKLIYD
jgi:hypothetical protein